MKIYIASHSQDVARQIAGRLTENGYEIVSRWIFKPFNKSSDLTDEQRRREAVADVNEVTECDLLVITSGPEKYSGGKFVEAGIALGLGRRVALIGTPENVLMGHPRIERYASEAEFIEVFCPDTDL